MSTKCEFSLDAVYGRVSTDAQSHASQLREVRAYVRRRWPKAEVVEYLDKASGARFSREGLDAMMAEIRKGHVNVLAVYKLDRLGRSLQHLAQLIGELEAHGTALVASSQGIDTSDSNPAGRLQGCRRQVREKCNRGANQCWFSGRTRPRRPARPAAHT
jgi:DNA invertase Pin-like site-specific DNA recombinase